MYYTLQSFTWQGDNLTNNDLIQSWDLFPSQNVLGEPIFNSETKKFSLQVSIDNLYYIKDKKPDVPLGVFFGIKAVDSEGLKSAVPKIVFLYLPSIIPETTTTTTTTEPPPTTTTTEAPVGDNLNH